MLAIELPFTILGQHSYFFLSQRASLIQRPLKSRALLKGGWRNCNSRRTSTTVLSILFEKLAYFRKIWTRLRTIFGRSKASLFYLANCPTVVGVFFPFARRLLQNIAPHRAALSSVPSCSAADVICVPRLGGIAYTGIQYEYAHDFVE